MGRNGALDSGKSGDRDALGHYLPGHSLPGPGRAPGSIEFMTLLRRKAKGLGVDADELIWNVICGTIDKAAKGDAAAAKIILDRACGILERGAEVKVAVDARTAIATGPPLPPRRERAKQLLEVHKIVADILGEEDAKDEAVETLLS